MRILLIGGNGAGKTTLARSLAKKLHLPLIHLDRLYWRGGWQPAPREEFMEQLTAELQKPAWIMDGNMKRTLPQRLGFCDTVIYLDFSSISCVIGVIRRILRYHGKSRPDMGGVCEERFDRRSWEFLKSVWRFNRNNRRDFYRMLHESGVPVIVLKNRRQVRKFLRQIGEPND